jgi:hypothetical protein
MNSAIAQPTTAAWDAQSIHDGEDLGSHQVIRDWFAVTGAATMTPAI